MGNPVSDPRRGAPPRRPITFDDAQQKNATEAAASSLGVMLESIGINRPISTITWDELNWLAVAAITGWVRARCDQQVFENTRLVEVPKVTELDA